MSSYEINNHNYSNKKGFSLIELVVGMALFVTLIGASTMMLFTALKNSRKSAAINRVRSDAAYVMDLIAKDIAYSTAINTCAATNLTLTRKTTAGDILVSYALDGATNRITQGGSFMTSNQVQVSTAGCAGNAMFSCSGPAVTICFSISSANGIDVSDTEDLFFRTSVVRRNPGT